MMAAEWDEQWIEDVVDQRSREVIDEDDDGIDLDTLIGEPTAPESDDVSDEDLAEVMRDL